MLIIKPAGKKGKGVFANKNFKKGETLLTMDYTKRKDFVLRKNIQKLPQKDQDHLDYVGHNRYVVDYSIGSIVNHSCEPNAYVKYETMRKKELIAIKNIKKCEEITIDGAIDAADNWTMKCYCGKNCRKTIYGNYKKLPKELQKKYWKYVPRWKKMQIR